jgi:hypothetical protein
MISKTKVVEVEVVARPLMIEVEVIVREPGMSLTSAPAISGAAGGSRSIASETVISR